MTTRITVNAKPKGLEMEIDRQQFALALKTWRLRQDLTQKEVAERWNCSRFSILRAERGHNIGWTTAYKLFAHLANELQRETNAVHNNY